MITSSTNSFYVPIKEWKTGTTRSNTRHRKSLSCWAASAIKIIPDHLLCHQGSGSREPVTEVHMRAGVDNSVTLDSVVHLREKWSPWSCWDQPVPQDSLEDSEVMSTLHMAWAQLQQALLPDDAVGATCLPKVVRLLPYPPGWRYYENICSHHYLPTHDYFYS